MAAKSYLDPTYEALAGQMEQRFGLPGGLLHNIVTKGERSNADQVSEKGAKTVFQITPATRKAALEKWGVDAYLNSENAAEVAARLLKDSLNRNGGDVKEAVGEYHGGTDRQNWGPRTRAYVGRVTSTFDRVKAQREAEQPQAPSIAKVYEAYKAGKLDPQARQEFEADVQSGAVLLPRGAKLEVADKPSGAVLPAGVVQAYNSHSEMSDGERAQLDKDIAAGLVQLPPGVKLQRPAARTGGEMLGMGARGVATGAAGLVDIAAGPLGSIMDAVIPGDAIAPDPARRIVESIADAAGLAKPGTLQEKGANAVIEGGTQGVLTAGGGAAMSGAKGATGVVARELAANPVTDIVASAAGAGGQEEARQSGAGPLVQLGAALVTGGAAGAATKSAARVAEMFGPKAARVVETIPSEVVLDQKGALTEEGREVAAANELTPEQVKGAYAEAAKPEPKTVRTHEGVDHPVEVLDPTPVDHEGVPHIKVRGEDGAEGYVPHDQVREVEAPQTPKDAPQAAPAASVAEEPAMPATAQARAADAASEGVDLTRGQATKDFTAQSAENDLAATQSPEGQKVRDHFTKQAEQIKAAVDRFKSAFGDPAATATERGQAVKDAIRELRDQGRAGVTALYGQAREAAEQLGQQGSNLIRLDTAPILQRMRELFIDEGVDDGVRKALKQQAAKYGLIGEKPRTVEGETAVTLRDHSGEPGGRIVFTGPPRTLDITNAEDFRQAVSALYEGGKRNQQEALKPLIDAAVGDAVERAAREAPGDVGQRFRDARAAHIEQKKTFQSGDVVQDLIDWKKGQRGTEKINPEEIFARIFKGGPEGLTNLRKVKAVLLNKATPKSRAAWQAVQAHGVAQLFNKATIVNANLGEAGLGAISGAKLNSEIARFGADKLKVLLSPEDFNQLMKLRRIIGDATIPLKGTINPSGSGHVMVRFLARQAQALAPVAKIVPLLRDVVQGAEEFAAKRATKETVEGVTSYKPKAPANTDAPQAEPLAWARKFLSVAGSDEIIAPLIASAANEERP